MQLGEEESRCAVRPVAVWLGVVLVSAAVTLCLPAPTAAQESEPHAPAGEPHEATEEHGEEHLHKHHVALFVGSTEAEEHHGEKDDPDFTLGFDYERRLNRRLGFGGMVDWVAEGNREGLIGPIGFLHLGKSAKFYAAPCYQRVRESSQDNFVFRLGFAWDFHIGKYAISPTAIYDFAEEQDFVVLGVALGMGF